MDESLKEKTKQTARCSSTRSRTAPGSRRGRSSTSDLARELSMFFTGKLYSREVISQKQRELCAVASLTVLNRGQRAPRPRPRRAQRGGHPRQEVAEVIFQQVTYGGMPVVVEALEVFRRVLEERGSGSVSGPLSIPRSPRRSRPRGPRESRAPLLSRRLRGDVKPDRHRSPRRTARRSRPSAACSAAPFPTGLPRRGIRRGGRRRHALDHRSDRRHQELHPGHPALGGARSASRSAARSRRASSSTRSAAIC